MSVPSPDLSARPGLAATVTAMLLAQAVSVLVFMTVPVMATEIAPIFGVTAPDIAVFLSVVFAAAMFCSAASGSLVHRFGGIRTTQLGIAFCAACLLLVLPASYPLLLLAALLTGLGYGPNTPAGSHVLSRVTRAEQRAFVFSLKQSGAPLGGLLCGLLVPAIVTSLGWRAALLTTMVIAITTALLLQPLRERLDDDREAHAAVGFAVPWPAITGILRNAPLRRLTLLAFCLTAIQAVVMSFLVIYYVEELGCSFTFAGAVFGASQAGGAVLRVVLGWLADRVLGAVTTLTTVALGSATLLFLLNGLEPGMPAALIAVAGFLLGAMSFGWNGVFLAEIADLAGPGKVGQSTGGALFFIYGGIVAGPLVVALLIRVGGGYLLPFCLIAATTVAAALNVVIRDRRSA